LRSFLLSICVLMLAGVCAAQTGQQNYPGQPGGVFYGPAGLSASSLYTVYMSSTSNCKSPSPTATTEVCAKNNNTGTIDYSGTDVAAVLNSIISANATVGGRIFFKQGVYPANSATLETATGCSNFLSSGNALAYIVGFPANTPFWSSVSWILEGENAQIWQGEAGSTSINTSGVVINVTATAISSVASGTFIAGFFARPVTNCTLVASNVSNDFTFTNIDIRFPTNQRGNEGGFVAWFADDVQYQGEDVADFALPYNSIATGSAPVVGTVGSFGFTSTVSSSGGIQVFANTSATGWNIGYDWESEHINGTVMDAIYCNYPAEVGLMGGAVGHSGSIRKFNDQENLHGLVFGPEMRQGSQFDILGYDIELGSSNWYARTTPNLTETNPGYTSGLITWTSTLQGTGFKNTLTTPSLFSSGGQNFRTINAVGQNTILLGPASDSFTRPNASSVGPVWFLPGFSPQTMGIASNAATINYVSGTGIAAVVYGGQTFDGGNQFSKVTCAAAPNNVNDVCEVTVNNSSGATETDYKYFCSNAAATGSGLTQEVSNTPTVLSSQTSASGCAAGDTIELDRYTDAAGHAVLIALHNGVLDANIPTNPYTITSGVLTGGAPGIEMVEAASGAVTMTNWSGGSLHVSYSTSGAINGYTH
jgi:hypothetical protein